MFPLLQACIALRLALKANTNGWNDPLMVDRTRRRIEALERILRCAANR